MSIGISKRTIIIVSTVLVVLIVTWANIGAALFYKGETEETAETRYRRYDFNDEMERSVIKLSSEEKAEIISGIETDENVIALTFDGVNEIEVMDEIIRLVGKYGVKGTFFLQGMEVAEYPRLVSDITGSGNEVGIYTLYGRKNMDKLPTSDLVEDFVYSSCLTEEASGIKPVYLRCNNTKYTDELLTAVAASGFEYVVDSTHILNYQSFSTYEMAYNYVQKLPKGAIVSIKMKGVLEEDEYASTEKTQDVGKKPSIKTNEIQRQLDEVERLLQVVEWVCKAVNETERGTVYVKELPSFRGSGEEPETPSVFPPGATEVILAQAPVEEQQQESPGGLAVEKRELQTAEFEALRDAKVGLVGEKQGLQTAEFEALRAVKAGVAGEERDLPISEFEAVDKVLFYAFYGISNESALNDVLSRLRLLGREGMFFVSARDIERYPQRISNIIDEGHEIGIAFQPRNDRNVSEAGSSLLEAHGLLEKQFGLKSRFVLHTYTTEEVSGEVKEAVSALGMTFIDYSVAMVRSADEFEVSAENVLSRVLGTTMDSLKYGNVVYFRMDYYKSTDTLVGDLLEKIAEREAALERIKDMRVANGGRLAEQINIVHTTEKALAYVFYGIAGEGELKEVLSRLKSQQITATFFVSGEDSVNYPDRVRAIIADGHEIGIALLYQNRRSFEDAGAALISAQGILAEQFGVETKLVMVPFGELSDGAREAVSAMGMTLIGQSVRVVRSADEFETAADKVLNGLFEGSRDSLNRGEIVSFRLGFYKGSDTLAGELVQKIKGRYVDNLRYKYDKEGISTHTIKGVGGLLTANPEFLYQYPLPKEFIPLTSFGQIRKGQLEGKNDDEVFDIMRRRYIGNPYVSKANMLPGFTDEQIEALDKTGRIDTKDKNVIFLTFDDWSTDLRGNHLLYVLKKHDVKASFFIRTNYVSDNPNLLRAIAADGHDLGSHTVNHMTLADHIPEEHVYTSITPEESKKLQTELIESYGAMQGIAGDIVNEKGFPVITRFFRAPTLAQSYLGMKAVFDCGYKYSISGDFSSGDYQARSVKEIKDLLNYGIPISGTDSNRTIGAGSIIVMHISPEAKFTAEAVDLFLTENAEKPLEERFYFARLSDYLGQ